jgi:hypothetical protein
VCTFICIVTVLEVRCFQPLICLRKREAKFSPTE